VDRYNIWHTGERISEFSEGTDSSPNKNSVQRETMRRYSPAWAAEAEESVLPKAPTVCVKNLAAKDNIDGMTESKPSRVPKNWLRQATMSPCQKVSDARKSSYNES
jgi:hypothetical protein